MGPPAKGVHIRVAALNVERARANTHTHTPPPFPRSSFINMASKTVKTRPVTNLCIPNDTEDELEQLDGWGVPRAAVQIFDACASLGPRSGLSKALRLCRALSLEMVLPEAVAKRALCAMKGEMSEAQARSWLDKAISDRRTNGTHAL